MTSECGKNVHRFLSIIADDGLIDPAAYSAKIVDQIGGRFKTYIVEQTGFKKKYKNERDQLRIDLATNKKMLTNKEIEITAVHEKYQRDIAILQATKQQEMEALQKQIASQRERVHSICKTILKINGSGEDLLISHGMGEVSKRSAEDEASGPGPASIPYKKMKAGPDTASQKTSTSGEQKISVPPVQKEKKKKSTTGETQRNAGTFRVCKMPGCPFIERYTSNNLKKKHFKTYHADVIFETGIHRGILDATEEEFLKKHAIWQAYAKKNRPLIRKTMTAKPTNQMKQ